ncbi:3-phosphoserine/phosphohydroxythreonine transaminase [soil metagenome]
MARLMNFNAGPAALPRAALERAQSELLELGKAGASVLEISHRGKEFEAIHHETIERLRRLAGIDDSWAVLLVQGGASQQFAQIPMAFLGAGKTAAYAVTGVWGEKAVQEAERTAKLLGGTVTTALTTKEWGTYHRAARAGEVVASDDVTYVHTTSNGTIHGLQQHVAPYAGKAPHVCDMSSDFLWKKTDFSPYSFVYAGAQKNIGPSGIVIVMAKKSFLETMRGDLPKIFDYRNILENDSLYNTPPTFSVYLARNVLAWVEEQGGVVALEQRNREKAALVYGALDAGGGFYDLPVERASRSTMNVVFRMTTTELEEKFLGEAKAAGMIGLKGHRSVGGMRASLYNAVEVGWAKALADLITDFAKKNG